MNNKITVLIGDKGTSGERFAEQMQRSSDDTYTLRRYGDIAITIKQGVVRCFYLEDNVDVADSDLVYLRGITYEPIRHVLAAYLVSKNVAVVNSESHNFQAMTKLEQYVLMALKGVPVPDSVFVSRPTDYHKAVDLLGSGYPVVSKSISGSNGRDNTLLKHDEDLLALDMPLPIFQSFMPNQFDYRVIVAGDEVALAYKRIRDVKVSSYMNNIAQGGRREMTDISDDLKAMAVRAAQSIGREFAGLDILTNSETGRSVVLEVNFNFGTPVFDDRAAEKEYYTKLSNYFTGLID